MIRMLQQEVGELPIAFTMETTSTSSTFAIASITYSGASPLKWEVTGDASGSYTGNTPTIDLSSNTGTAILTVYGYPLLVTDLRCNSNSLTALDVSNNTSLVTLYCNSNSLTALDVSTNTGLVSLACNSNSLTALDVSNNTSLVNLACNSNSLTALDVSNNTSLVNLFCHSNSLTSTEIDNIYIDLDSNGESNGTLVIGSGRTATSDTARANLITKTWTITD